jgi:ABC-2 type transport system ATP-binding protein
MIEGGRIIFSDTMDAFNNYMQASSILMSMENPPSLAALQTIKGATKAEFLTDKKIRLYFDGDQEITERLIAASMEQGWRLREISLEKGLLEDVFKQLSTQSH